MKILQKHTHIASSKTNIYETLETVKKTDTKKVDVRFT